MAEHERIANERTGCVRYLRRDEFDAPPAPFRCGEGGHLWVADHGDFERDTRLRLSANTTHALLGHGVVEALNRLPLMGTLGGGLDTVVPQAALRAAAEILYEADRKTYGGTWEFEAGVDASGTACRVCIDNREYQKGLLRLTDLLNSASRVGYGVWLRI